MEKPPLTEPTGCEIKDRITYLEREIGLLHARIDDLVKAYKTTTTDTYDTFRSYLWPLLFKVFPRFSETIRQSDAILKVKCGPSDDVVY